MVVFLLGAASTTALFLIFLTATSRPAWPALETVPQRRGEVPGSVSVRSSTPTRGNGSVGVEQHTGETVPPLNETGMNDGGEAELARMLQRAATDDRTVILTSVNEAWARPGSLLDLFRESFRNGEGIERLLNHTLIVAVDAGGFDHCKAVHPHCYLLEVRSANLSAASRFLSKGYLELVWAKLSLQQRVLELGYNYLFTDVDVMWFRDPFRHINLYADVTVSSDRFSGKPESLKNTPNTGFYYVKSTSRTVEMLRYWREARSRFPASHHDQKVFNKIKHEMAGKLGVRTAFLDTALFGTFCKFHDEIDGRMCVMHASCCIGLENKVHDLTSIAADWKNYTSSTPEKRKKGGFKWTYPARCQKSNWTEAP